MLFYVLSRFLHYIEQAEPEAVREMISNSTLCMCDWFSLGKNYLAVGNEGRSTQMTKNIIVSLLPSIINVFLLVLLRTINFLLTTVWILLNLINLTECFCLKQPKLNHYSIRVYSFSCSLTLRTCNIHMFGRPMLLVDSMISFAESVTSSSSSRSKEACLLALLCSHHICYKICQMTSSHHQISVRKMLSS